MGGGAWRSHKCHTIYKTSFNCCGLIGKRSKMIYNGSFSLVCTVKSLPAAGAEKNGVFESLICAAGAKNFGVYDHF